MEPEAYRQFAVLEEEHFWFRGRRKIFFALLDRLLASRLEEAETKGEPLEILEIGCGAGNLLRRLSRYGRTKGLELSRELATLCQERSRRPTLCANAYHLPLPDESQDLVCLFDTIEHIPDEAKALGEIQRVLRPGGLVMFSVPAYQFLYSNNDRVAHHCRRYTKGRLQASLKEAGLTPIKATYFNLFLFPLILPAVLFTKVKDKVFGLKNEDHTNLSVKIPKFLNEALALVMGSEAGLLPRLNFPTGHSLIVVAKK
ncbi:MAG TPA: SAM-dependent methyltransferase [Planctomycetes bacterium]|nr:SAM-dependent methyltransferase [Planctomycetota bacterium]